MTRVKICGFTNVQDIEAACALGVDAVGFVLEPSSPRFIESDAKLRDLVRATAPFVTTVSVYTECNPGVGVTHPTMVDQAERFRAFRTSVSKCIATRRLRSGMTAQQIVEGIEDFAALLLDPYVPGMGGGTGKTADWDLAAKVVTLSVRPVILAGGLTPQNVHEAMSRVCPAAVDVSSGVEHRPGVKDVAKMRDFIAAVRG